MIDVVYDLKKPFYWSAGFHAAALIFLLLSPYLPFRPYQHREERITWITLPKGTGSDLRSIKKALDLPKTTIQEQKKERVEEKPVKKEMTYKETPAKPPPKKTEEELRMEKVLAQARRDVASRKAVVPEAAQIPDAKPGGSPEGTVGRLLSADDPEKILYQQKIRERIMEEWIPPLKFQDPSLGLICQVIVRMNERGEVFETKWEQKSGNEAFDLSASRAISKASPLPLPPERLKWEAIHEGILVEFNPALLRPLPR